MKRVINFLVGGAIVLSSQVLMAQSADDSRMNRDVEIAENILSTLIKQEFDKRNFFPVEIRGSYRSGYGVTFTVPTNMLPMVYGKGDFVILDGTPGAYSYSFSTTDDCNDCEELEVLEREKAENEKVKADQKKSKAELDKVKAEKEKEQAAVAKEKAAQEMAAPRKEQTRYKVAGGTRTRVTKADNRDSVMAVTNAKIIVAAKNFLADYGDLLSQLKADEKVVITNKDNNQRWYYGENSKRSILIVEASKGDIAQYRQGKITRDQFLSKIKVTNTESTGKVEPDLELLTSIFNRLYDNDLSSTYYLSGNSYYERLTDFGAVVYMQVYSSNETDGGLFNMPTTELRRVDRATRDAKVKELYPTFESELKENILEYGRTVRSLKDNEQLVFNVILTKCKGCGIPADLEVSVPNSVLKDYNTGKLDKSSALSKVAVKKGVVQ
ncbi:MAG TPA: cell envelope integrity protein TolA [Cyclobacteriaceae bacterium]|nr:cell envelope integrity protein TolA [Cyclobacteriaceae bacterium]